MNPVTNNPPTVASLVTAFVTALLTWGWSAIPESVPVEVTTSGYAVALAVVGLVVGKLSQRWTWPVWKVQAEFISPTETDHGGVGPAV